MQQCRTHACIECFTPGCQGHVLRYEDWQEFLDHSPNGTSGCNGKSASPSSTHVAQVAEAGFNVNMSTIYIRDWSAINGSSLATASGLTSNLPRTSLHFLCTHILHCEQWMEFSRTPPLQTAHGKAPELQRTSIPGLDHNLGFLHVNSPSL